LGPVTVSRSHARENGLSSLWGKPDVWRRV